MVLVSEIGMETIESTTIRFVSGGWGVGPRENSFASVDEKRL